MGSLNYDSKNNIEFSKIRVFNCNLVCIYVKYDR